MSSGSLTIVIPAYNEEVSLREFLPSVLQFCQDKGIKLIVVNDGSTDKTQAVLDGFASSATMLVIRNKKNTGYGGAIKKGIQAADTTYVLTLDADGQHYLEDAEKLFKEITAGDADMVIGNRKGNPGGSYYRGMGKLLIRGIARILMPLDIYDINSGMKIYDTTLAQKYLSLCPDSMAFSDIIALVFINQRHLVLETPIRIRERKGGKSTINTLTAFETIKQILNIVVLFNPMRIFFPIAVLCILGSIAWGLPIILAGRGVSVGAMLGIVTGIFFFFFGLVAEQLSLIRKGRL